MTHASRAVVLRQIYQRLYKRYGPQDWWPADSPFEVVVGAILTQNTNWKNVEKALINLKNHSVLNPTDLYATSISQVAEWIRPAGYYNVKARRLHNFLKFFIEVYQGSFAKMKRIPWHQLRNELLSVNGIGPETADAILLYTLNKPVFVIDAYTRRILYRHGLIESDIEYHALQKIFMEGLDSDVEIFNEYHALIVRLAKEHCRVKPDCHTCPINTISYSLENKCHLCHRCLTRTDSICTCCL